MSAARRDSRQRERQSHGWALALALAALWLLLATPGALAQTVWRAGVVQQAPYAVARADGSLAGYDVDLLEHLAQGAKASIQWHTYEDLAALDAARDAGQIDLAPGALQTPSGLRRWSYTDPYLRVPFLLIGARDDPATPLAQLPTGARVLVANGDPLFGELRQGLPNLRLERAEDARTAMRSVAESDFDHAVLDEVQFDRLAGERIFAGLVQHENLGYPLLRRIAVRADWQPFARELDAGITDIPASLMDTWRRRWLGTPPTSLPSSILWRNLAILAGVVLATLTTLLILHVRLRPQLERRIQTLRRELTVREEERRALRLTQFSVDESVTGILWVNWDSRIRYVNAAAARLLGLPPVQLHERLLEDFDPDLHMDRWLTLWRQVREGPPPADTEREWRRGDGNSVPVALSVSFLRFDTAEYLVMFVVDLTEKRRAEAALAEREAQLRGIATNVPGVVFRMELGPSDDGALLTYASEGSQQLVGYSPAWLTHPTRGLRALVHPLDLDSYLRRRDAAMAGERDWHWQGRLRTATGAERWVDLKAAMRRLDDDRVVWDGVVWDIHDNKRAELALADSQAQLRELSAHLETVREEEKARIAREVHDELGQVLTALKFELSMLGILTPDPTEPQQARMQAMQGLIRQLFQLVRDVATALRPPILDAGIVSAIEWQARRFESRSGVACLVLAPEHLPPLSDAQATGLFRILQEALTNVMRHAQAHSVEIQLVWQDGMLTLTVADDGVGLQPQAADRRSFGVVGMRERVLMLGGRLDIDSQPGNGTTLTASVPLPGSDASARSPGESS